MKPGYWKHTKHLDSWVGFTPNLTLDSVFDVPDAFGLDNEILLNALGFTGSSGTSGSARILLRGAVSALLNASNPDVDYPLTVVQVNAVLPRNDRRTMLSLGKIRDGYNNLGCPVD